MKHIHYDQPGNVEVMTFKESPLPVLKEDYVLMKITHVGINRVELMQRQGKIPVTPGHPPILGLEAAGYVVDSELKELYPAIGLFPGGSYSQYAQLHKDHVIPLPQGVSLEQGAGIPEAWITAYQILKYIAQVQSGEYVMIYAGASGVGTAAIQLCKLFKAHAIVSASSEEKLNVCKSLGAELCLNYKTQADQKEQILNFTGGNGVNIVLDCIGAQNYALTDAILGQDGRWVNYGQMGGSSIENFNLGSLIRRRISLITTMLKNRTDAYKADLIKRFKEDTLQAFANGALKPIIDRVINVTWDESGMNGWRAAHQAMESNENTGKIIVALPKL